jgi:FKBP-type peptidyl-prolyl cis-trans isomerase FkpA
MKKPILSKEQYARVFGAVLLVTACGGGSGSVSTTPGAATGAGSPTQPVGDVERTTFSPSLNIRLDSMVRRASGLYVQDVMMGNGSVATRGRTAIVRYAGWLANGKAFDSGEISVTLGSNKTIRAWEEGLLGMRVGGRRRLVVPPSMGYGARGNGDVIPPSAVLVFEMELVSVM